MALYNNRPPIYYERFRNAVMQGLIPVNEKISMEMNRIDELIENPMYYYDPDAVEGWVTFCEAEMTLTDGSPLRLLDSFKLWAEQLYGWYYFVKKSVWVPDPENPSIGKFVTKKVKYRLTTKQYLIVARGAAKSHYDSCVQAYELTVSSETTQQITTAPVMDLAMPVVNAIVTSMTVAPGPLFQFLTTEYKMKASKPKKASLVRSKNGLINHLTNSTLEVHPMTIDKLQGLRPKVSTVDEWLSGDNREDVIGALEQGASKVENPIILATSSEGTVRDGVGDTIKMELMKILKGEFYAPHVSIWWYCLDSIEEIANPAMWLKANPNLGITVSYDAYQKDVTRAEQVPAARNDIIAKRFGIPMEGLTYYFTYDEIQCHKHREFWQMDCSLGIDLSQGDDFCAFTFLFPLKDGSFGVKTRCYITSVTLDKLALAMRQKYEEFINEGTLIIMEDRVNLFLTEVYDDLMEYIRDSEYNVLCVGYDPYNAKDFIKRWCDENSSFGVEKVIQGKRTESVPLGELKNLASERMLLFDQKIMKFTLGNSIAVVDTNGNKQLYKKRGEEKIDSVAAMMDAYVAYNLNTDSFMSLPLEKSK